MTDTILSLYKDQTDRFLGPARDFNKLAVAQFERLAQLQLESLQDYTELGLAQIKSASAVKDVADIQDHLGRQNEILKSVGEKFAADVRAMLDIGKTFGDEAQQIARDGVSGIKPGES